MKECCEEAVAAAIIDGEFVDGETAVEGLFWTTIDEEFVAAVVAWLTCDKLLLNVDTVFEAGIVAADGEGVQLRSVSFALSDGISCLTANCVSFVGLLDIALLDPEAQLFCSGEADLSSLIFGVAWSE